MRVVKLLEEARIIQEPSTKTGAGFSGKVLRFVWISIGNAVN